jgi:putative redox protein
VRGAPETVGAPTHEQDAARASAERQPAASPGRAPSVQPAALKPPNKIRAAWAGGQRFDAGRPGRRTIRIDGSGETGPGPVDSLLSALAACAGTDVTEILAKRRTPVERLEIEVTGRRVAGVPRRLEHLSLRFEIRGAGIERVHAERAVELAVTKYCSVRDSLARDIPLEWTVVLNGEEGAQE